MAGRRSRHNSLYAGDARTLAASIKAAREAKGFTQEDLAHAAELSLSTVQKIERSAIVEPGFFPVMAILEVVDLEPQRLKLRLVQRVRRRASALSHRS